MRTHLPLECIWQGEASLVAIETSKCSSKMSVHRVLCPFAGTAELEKTQRK